MVTCLSPLTKTKVPTSHNCSLTPCPMPTPRANPQEIFVKWMNKPCQAQNTNSFWKLQLFSPCYFWNLRTTHFWPSMGRPYLDPGHSIFHVFPGNRKGGLCTFCLYGQPVHSAKGRKVTGVWVQTWVPCAAGTWSLWRKWGGNGRLPPRHLGPWLSHKQGTGVCFEV